MPADAGIFHFKTGAGEGNRTLVVSLGSRLANGSTIRAGRCFLLHKIRSVDLLKAAIRAALFRFVEQIFANIRGSSTLMMA
jgi:hypothetical protein